MSRQEIISEYLAAIGRRGGQARVKKGIGVLTKEEQSERGKQAAAARWAKARSKTAEKPVRRKA